MSGGRRAGTKPEDGKNSVPDMESKRVGAVHKITKGGGGQWCFVGQGKDLGRV